MRLFTLLICFLFFANFTISQPLLIQEFTEFWDLGNPKWEKNTLRKYEYDNRDNLVLSSYERWSTTSETWKLYNTVTNTYDSENNLISSIEDYPRPQPSPTGSYSHRIEHFYAYNSENQIIYDSTKAVFTSFFGERDTSYIIKNYAYNEFNSIEHYQEFSGNNPNYIYLAKSDSFEYDENQCLIQYFESNNPQNVPSKKTEYEYFEDCLIKQESVFSFSFNENEYQPSTRVFYEYPENNVEIHSSQFFDAGIKAWKDVRTEHFQYDENDNLIFKLEEDHISDNVRKYEYTFNESGEKILEEYYLKTHPEGDFELQHLYDITINYNKNGWKTLQDWNLEFFASAFLFKRTDTWDYFCDGTVKTEKFENLSENNISRTHFTYDKLTDCQENKADLTLNISPNPTAGILQINSNLLSAQNHQVNIYSTDGRFLRTQSVDFRTEEMTLDLSDLSDGIYFIEVKNEGGQLTEKVVIAK